MFSEQDIHRIRDTVRAAEQGTRGEIVPMVVPASGIYHETRHLLGGILALLMLAVLLLLNYRSWSAELPPAWIMLGVLAAYLAGHYLGSWPVFVRLLADPQRMDMKVRRRAEAAFYEHGLHKTREGTGILIMISLLERRVQVLADKAINEKVPPETWVHLVKDLIHAIKEGRATEGLCRMIVQCGELLAQHFPARSGDNPDELGGDLIQQR